MKVQVKVSPTTIVEAEGQTLQDVFEQLSRLEEVFNLSACGLCKGTSLRHQVRVNEGYTFFELVCQNSDCRARFSFGQPKNVKGGLFPQRKEKDGSYKPNGGWVKYEKKDYTSSRAQSQQYDESGETSPY